MGLSKRDVKNSVCYNPIESSQAYQILGIRTLEQIKKQDLLPESPMNLNDIPGYIKQLKSNWLKLNR
jgi:hypothetical protein